MMMQDSITPLIKRFINVIDSLIEDFMKYKLDEEAIIFIANKTRNFIGFTKLALLNVIFKILEKVDVKYVFDDEIKLANEIIEKIFDNINNSLNVILTDEDEEEHVHLHHHEHEHHHVDVDNIQEDINIIRDNLIFLKKIVLDLGKMVVSLLKYQSKHMDEDEFKKEYCKFKSNINKYKNEFENNFK